MSPATITVPTIKEILEYADISLIDCPIGGMTKEVHLAQIDGKKYILRRGKTKENADRYEGYSRALEGRGITPKIFERDGNDILYEFLDGRDLTYDDLDYAREIGRISGIVNEVPNSESPDIDFRFSKATTYLLSHGIITEEEKKKAEERYFQYRPDKLIIASELTDVIPGNFRYSQGKIYLVDIDAIWPMTKGRGFAKAFVKWFRDDNSRERFLAGYNEVGDSSFFTPDYQQFVYLNFLVHKIRDWHKRGTPFQKVKGWLQDSLEGKLN